MPETKDLPETPTLKQSYEAVRQPMRDVQAANDLATATGSARVTIGGQEYKVTRDKSSGRSMTPVEKPAEQPQKP